MENSVIKTLAFFDIFKRALTKEDLFLYLWSEQKINQTEFDNILNSLMTQNKIKEKDGCYFLFGRDDIMRIQKNRDQILKEKIKIAQKSLKKISWVPFVEAVFVCNSVALESANDDSDIDFFIITKNKRIFWVRFLTAVVLRFLNRKRQGQNIKNKICLSFYLADDYLDLEKISIKDDVYLIYWMASLRPLYDPQNYKQKIWDNNLWAKNKLSNFVIGDNNILYKKNKIKVILEKIFNHKTGDFLEGLFKKILLKKMNYNKNSHQNNFDTGVVVNSQMLKFHEDDRREEYSELWKRCW